MDQKLFVTGVFAVVLAAVAPVFLAGAPALGLNAFVFPDVNAWWAYALLLFPALFLALLGLAILKELLPDRSARLLFWGAAVLSGTAIIALLDVPLLPGTFLFATYLGGFFPLLTNDPCKKGVWKTVTAPKAFAALLVFLFVYFVAAHTPGLQDQFVDKVVDLSLASAGSGQGFDVNAILSPNVTPAERQQLIQRVKASTPDWDKLTESQKQALINNYLQAYAQTKKVIYQTLANSIHVPDKAQMKEALRKQVQNMPIMQQIVRFLPAIAGFSVAIYYTLVEFLAELAAFAVGFPLVWLLRRAVRQG